ncbi:MAG: thioesterase family protein [Acidimicrobiaceae bacterium]|nr:thioesterase family protein [Acidimicrobiaceae bacterium]
MTPASLASPNGGDGYLFDFDTKVVDQYGSYHALISPNWNIGKKPNGGYLMAILNRAFQKESDKPHCLSITAHYLRSPDPGPCELDVVVEKAGKTITNVSGRLISEGKTSIVALATYGDLENMVGLNRQSAKAPEVDPPSLCEELNWPDTIAGAVGSQMPHRFEMRVPKDSPFNNRKASGTQAKLAVWMRFADDRPIDADSVPLFLDSAPPAIMAVVQAGWIPTIDLTIHLRKVPTGNWVLGLFATDTLINGLLEEDGTLWDEDLNLIATSRQQAMLLVPEKSG